MRVKHLKINWGITLEILAIGMAPFSMQIAGSFVQGLLNKKLIDFGGDLAVGAMGIINSVLTLIIMAIVALNMASQPIIGFNYGAKSVQRIKDTLKITLIAATLIAIVSYALIEAFPGYIIMVFNNDSQVLYNIATRGLRLVILALPVVGFQVVASNFFQAIGKAGLSMFATVFRQVIMLIPLIYILPGFFDIDGIWISYPVADTMSAIVVGFILYREWKRLPVLVENSNEE